MKTSALLKNNNFCFNRKNKKKSNGFSLIEVLIALSILAISLTAILQATSQNIKTVSRIQEKMLAHWVALQAINMIQIGMVDLRGNQNKTMRTLFLGKAFYWRTEVKPSLMQDTYQINIMLSKNQAGPFTLVLTGFKYNEKK